MVAGCHGVAGADAAPLLRDCNAEGGGKDESIFPSSIDSALPDSIPACRP